MTRHCFYCNSRKHNVEDCINAIPVCCDVMCNGVAIPNFEAMTKNMLKSLLIVSTNSDSYRQSVYNGNFTSCEYSKKNTHASLVSICIIVWNNIYALRNQTEVCPICYENLTSDTPICITNCKHTFCTSCFVQLLEPRNRMRVGANCPICRHVI